MSWRFLIALLLVAAGLSAWGGLRLGDWLVAHSPAAPIIEEPPELKDVPVLDADGRPFVAQAPQPLLSGRQGVPDKVEPIEWEVAQSALDEIKHNPLISIATTQISMDEARQLSMGSDGLMGIGSVGGLLGSETAPGTGVNPSQDVQPIDITVPPPPPPPPPVAGDQDWQAALAREIEACSHEGFFSRPSCAWAARNKYCGPNNAWGRAANCPPRNQ